MRRLSLIDAVSMSGNEIIWIDQTKLPFKEKYVGSSSVSRLCTAIKRLEIRGAPLIGIAAAFGIAAAAANSDAKDSDALLRELKSTAKRINSTRPTAVNLQNCINRMMKKAEELPSLPKKTMAKRLREEAYRIKDEEEKASASMGRYGSTLIKNGDVILTHCNTGSLATAGVGTALGVIRTAYASGKNIKVIACETRPLLQGARLTAWELKRDSIPFELITDSAAAYAMKNRGVSKVIVGADRILLDGSTANKIGTYALAIIAKEHNIPFYVAAPVSTIDPRTKTANMLKKIEQRSPEEVLNVLSRLRIAKDANALNPAFDITPGSMISGIITEKGVARKPYQKSLAKAIRGA